jgi:hypothetical protein
VDYKYIRHGTCSIFLFNEPLGVGVMQMRCRIGLRRIGHIKYAASFRTVSDAEKVVVLVVNNLNIHTVSSLYEAFSPEVAFNLAQRLEIHFTPKQGLA